MEMGHFSWEWGRRPKFLHWIRSCMMRLVASHALAVTGVRWSVIGLVCLWLCTMGLCQDSVSNQAWVIHFNQSSLSTVLIDNDTDCMSLPCLRFPSATVSIHRHFQTMLLQKEESASTPMEKFFIPSCQDLERLLISDKRRAVVIFEEFSPLRSSAHSIWYWLDSCGLLGSENSNVYLADMREFYNVETETYVSDAETCSMRSDAVNFLSHVWDDNKTSRVEEVWFLFPYYSQSFKSTLNNDAEDYSLSVLLWNQLHSYYCTFISLRLNTNSWESFPLFHFGTLRDSMAWLTNKSYDSFHIENQKTTVNSVHQLVQSSQGVYEKIGKYSSIPLQFAMVTESIAYVYICINPNQLPLAQWFVAYWKEQRRAKYSSTFMRYRVITISRNDNDVDGLPSWKACWRDSLRLSAAETGQYDLVTILLGIEGILSFSPPSLHDHETMLTCQYLQKTQENVTSNQNKDYNIGFIPYADIHGSRSLFCPPAPVTLKYISKALTPSLTSILILSDVLHLVERLRNFRHKTILLHEQEKEMFSVSAETSELRFQQSLDDVIVELDTIFPNFVHWEGRGENIYISVFASPKMALLETTNHFSCGFEASGKHSYQSDYCDAVASFVSHRFSTRPMTITGGNFSFLFPSAKQANDFAEKMLYFDHMLEPFDVYDSDSIMQQQKSEIIVQRYSQFMQHISSAFSNTKERNNLTSNILNHLWLRQIFDAQPATAWFAFHLYLPPALPTMTSCPLNQVIEYLSSMKSLHAEGRWLWHTWTLLQAVDRAVEYVEQEICSSTDLYDIVYDVSTTFIERSCSHMKHFPYLTHEELTTTQYLLIVFQVNSLADYLDHFDNDELQYVFSTLRMSINMHQSVVAQMLADSVWCIQRFLEASLMYAPLLKALPKSLKEKSPSEIRNSLSFIDMERHLHAQWINEDRPKLEQLWCSNKEVLVNEGQLPVKENKIYLLTYGTERTEGLENLLLTSIVSGLSLEVIGLGNKWKNLGDLILGTAQFLDSHNDDHKHESKQASWTDDDVVVIVDAYDILLTPVMRRVVRDVLLLSDVPIVISSEEYSYPEELLTWSYPRVEGNLPNIRPRGKFLNSGIVVGQVKYLRYSFQQLLLSEASLFGNDQHQWARYLVLSQGRLLMDIDTSMRLAFSTYKHGRLSGDILKISNLLLPFYNNDETLGDVKIGDSLQQIKYLIQTQSIMAYHGNNLASIALYDAFWEKMRTIIEKFLQDRDRELLLQMLWAFYDADMATLNMGIDQLREWKNNPSQGISEFASHFLESCELFGDVFTHYNLERRSL